MTARKPRRPAPPLNDAGLAELALAYVGRFATTKAKLRAYLGRKLRERGWDGPRAPDLDALADDFAKRGFIDDAAYALAKARALADRGYGKRRLDQKLWAAGVDEADGSAARAHSEAEAVGAALRFARRRRLGPFAAEAADGEQQRKALGAMVRAGHDFGLSRAILALAPGAPIDCDDLAGHAN